MSVPTLRRLVLILVAGVAVYLPGIGGGFAFDDFHNIVDNPYLAVDPLDLEALVGAALSSDAGPLKRPLAMLSFALNRGFAGVSPRAYKLTNLAIHAVNGLLVFFFLRLVFQYLGHGNPEAAARRAFVCALIWVVHPLQLTSVLYVVQRMTSLSALWVLLSLLCYTAARERTIRGRQTAWPLFVAVAGCALLGLLSKENAVVLPLYLLVLELTVFRFAGSRLLRPLFVLGLGVPAVLGVLWLLVDPAWVTADYALRPYTLAQRLLTEARVLLFYLGLLIFPRPSALGIFHDDFPLSYGWFEPWDTGLAVVVIVAALASAWVLRRRAPLWAFAVGWYLAGHALESSIYPLDLVYEHRNYLPVLGFIAFAVWGAQQLLTGRQGRSAVYLVTFGVVAALGVTTAGRALQWSDPIVLAQTQAAHHPRSQSAVYELGRIYYRMYELTGSPQHRVHAVEHLHAALGLGDEDFLPLSALLIASQHSAAVADPALAAALQRTLREDPPIPRRLTVVSQNIACQAKGDCPADPGLVLRLVEAALANPALAPFDRARILAWLAIYYVNVLGDVAAALPILQETTDEHPGHLPFRLHLAEALILSGQAGRASYILAGAPPPSVWQRLAGHNDFVRLRALRQQAAGAGR